MDLEQKAYEIAGALERVDEWIEPERTRSDPSGGIGYYLYPDGWRGKMYEDEENWVEIKATLERLGGTEIPYPGKSALDFEPFSVSKIEREPRPVGYQFEDGVVAYVTAFRQYGTEHKVRIALHVLESALGAYEDPVLKKFGKSGWVEGKGPGRRLSHRFAYVNEDLDLYVIENYNGRWEVWDAAANPRARRPGAWVLTLSGKVRSFKSPVQAVRAALKYASERGTIPESKSFRQMVEAWVHPQRYIAEVAQVLRDRLPDLVDDLSGVGGDFQFEVREPVRGQGFKEWSGQIDLGVRKKRPVAKLVLTTKQDREFKRIRALNTDAEAIMSAADLLNWFGKTARTNGLMWDAWEDSLLKQMLDTGGGYEKKWRSEE